MTRGERIRLGIFTLIGIALAGVFFYLTVGRSMLEKNDYYTIEYTDESVSGLNIGNAVKMRGVSIGRVEDLYFAKNDIGKIVVKISVRRGIFIPGDAVAVIEVFGITGMKYIDLVRGTSASTPYKPGAVLATGISTIGMVTGKAEDIAQKIEVALNNIISFTGSDKIQNLAHSSTNTVQDVDNLVRNLNALIIENRSNIAAIGANLNTFTGKLSGDEGLIVNRTLRVLDRVDSAVSDIAKLTDNKSLQKSLKNIEEATNELQSGINAEQIKKTVASLNKTLETTNQAAVEIGRTFTQSRDRMNQILDRLEVTTKNLSDFTAKIKDNPSLLIRKQEY
ncbi:MAG: MCE family protein [Fibrobacteres bacterium]|nr:MCE family protein [Fibrobacterota bacterium]